jgi:hypothetical protein
MLYLFTGFDAQVSVFSAGSIALQALFYKGAKNI